MKKIVVLIALCLIVLLGYWIYIDSMQKKREQIDYLNKENAHLVFKAIRSTVISCNDSENTGHNG